MAVRSCCQCNGSNAKCLRCSSVRSKTPCSSCHPSWSGRCRYISSNIPSNILSTHNTPSNIPSTHVLSTHVSSTHVPSNQTPFPTVTLSATFPSTSPDPVSPSPNVLPPSLLSLQSLIRSPVPVSSCFSMYLRVPVTCGQVWSPLNWILSCHLPLTWTLGANSWCLLNAF